MKKDWVVWVWCFLLFLAGVTWGSISLKKDGFWQVDSIHDLFEIFGVFATFVAVCYAAVGLNTWKKQIGAAHDHDLARRVAISVHKYRPVILRAWGWAEFSSAQVSDFGTENYQEPEFLFRQKIDFEIKNAHDSRAEFVSLELECKAMWGALLQAEIKSILKFEERCAQCLNNYYAFTAEEATKYLRGKNVININMHWEWFRKNNALKYEDAVVYLDSKILELTQKLEPKLLR